MPRMEKRPKMKKMKAATLKNLGIEFIKVVTRFLILGKAFIDLRGLRILRIRKVVREELPKLTNSKSLKN